MAYWQIASGDGNADFEDVFLKLNIALIGPGTHGDYFDNKSKWDSSGSDGKFVRWFAEDVKVNDIFVLRVRSGQNQWQIKAVGRVSGPYRFEPIFMVNIYEWDIPHCRRVQWTIPNSFPNIQGGGIHTRIHPMKDDNALVKAA